MSEYENLVKSLDKSAILSKWSEVTPLEQISGIPRSAGSESSSADEFLAGHDEEQIRLMEELCIVLDYNDEPVGAGTKKLCHIMDNINEGLLHRAFLVFLFNERGELLLQQRASEKITFADMWTNTCCSHPLCVPSELGVSETKRDINSLENAVAGAKVAAQRKLDHELGIAIRDVPTENFDYLTRIHYKSPSGAKDSKWGEHEIDYILILKTKNDIPLNPNWNEVRDHKWVTADKLREMFEDSSLVFTPWFKLICQSFLFKWWDNLSDLTQFQDDTIHRLL
ncbi:isopentenyl-diphosphate delta-isomerase idi1 [Scheffersomyces spartinae]|uniref:Isopentenyl-diphosphate Delta-isomerase n=1 Tax=Scheffersomyces spartinae TaxID=45513 RepID=A0A9P8AHE4_9ASCO|nr:isopentenyl-diphosphate delta-isomerase idi1 [Scheffersomyces spartinae]KAG7193257.1 isopentenyl-diphosphate delta-isomerase idi1 [Scheffersomyces spartinae]